MHAAALVLIAAAAVRMHVQVSTDVQVLVDRMGRYLVEYETQLSTVVAKERYRQVRRFTTSAKIVPPP